VNILVIGDSCEDIFVYGKATRLSPESPAPVFNPIYKKKSGGMARNVSNILSSFGLNVDIITNKNKIIKERFIDSDSNYLFLRVDINDKCERVEGLKNIDFIKYDFVVISDYNKGFLTIKDIEKISKLHKNTFLDTKKKLGPWCKNIKFIKINRNEYLENKKYVDKKISDKTIITLDKEGCRFNNIIYASQEKDFIDRTGAGDCFLASLVCHFSRSENIINSIKFANKQALKYISKKK
jgi:D-glycero-beta-D-manno-heptose-7-phosphate kinase